MSSTSDQAINKYPPISKHTIDIRKVIKSKNKRLAKILPGFIISYLKRILHEKDLNNLLYEKRDKYGFDFVDEVLKSFELDISVEGLENVKNEDRFIIAANHPLGGLDGISLIQTVSRVHSNIRFPVNDFLLYLTNMKYLLIPINKVGKQSISTAKEFDNALASDINILYFPAGLASRKVKGKIVDLEWKKTFIQKAKKHERNIIPTFISGQNSDFFYRLANFRKFFRIKTNIEMFYLVDEVYKQKGNKLKIVFGKPIPYSSFDKSKKDVEWAKYVKEIVYNLGENY